MQADLNKLPIPNLAVMHVCHAVELSSPLPCMHCDLVCIELICDVHNLTLYLVCIL